MERVRNELDIQACLEQFQHVINSPKGELYKRLVVDIPYKQGCRYLNTLNKLHRKAISRFRLRNVFHRCETGSWYRVPRDMRLCGRCDVLDSDMHYLLHCSLFESFRPSFFLVFCHELGDTDAMKAILGS